MEKVNELCRKLREDAGLSVTELAAALGVHKSTVSSIELGRYNVSLNTAKKYADLFGKKYEPDLTKHLIRYDCGEKINQLLKARGITQKRFANALGIPYGTAAVLLARGTGSNGILARGVFEEEIPVLARYFHVEESEFRINKYYTDTVGVSTTPKLTDKVKVIDPAPDAPKPKKTAQMICEEEKKMEYEEALKKAKEYDILEAKYKEKAAIVDDQNKQLDTTLKEMLRVNDVCSKLRDRVNELEKLNKTLNADYSSLYSEHDETLNRLDNLTEIYNDLKASKPPFVEVIPEDYNQVLETNKRYKDVLFDLLLKRYEEKTK